MSESVPKYWGTLFFYLSLQAMQLIFFLKGIVIGLMGSIPMGPIGVLCLQRTLNKGRTSGFISGLGAASADTIFASIATLSVGFILTFIEQQIVWLRILGGLVIVVLGVRVFMSNLIKQIRAAQQNKSNLWEDYFSVFFLTLANPMLVFFFIAMFAAVGLGDGVDPKNFSGISLLIGVFAGAVLWWFILSTLINFFRKKFRLKQLWWINKITGALIALLGILSMMGYLF